MWSCFFLISGREGKWWFFISCKASGYKKSLMPRGSAAQGFVVYYDIFFSSFPQLSPIQTLSGSVILRINGSGRGQAQSLFILYEYIVVCIINLPQHIYVLYELFCFTNIFWVNNWSPPEGQGDYTLISSSAYRISSSTVISAANQG